jgi:hypothetical protein
MAGDVDRAGCIDLPPPPASEAGFLYLLHRLAWLERDLGGSPWRIVVDDPPEQADLRVSVAYTALDRAAEPVTVFVARGITFELAELMVQLKNNLPAILERAATPRRRSKEMAND